MAAEEVTERVLEFRDSKFLCDWAWDLETRIRDELTPVHFNF